MVARKGASSKSVQKKTRRRATRREMGPIIELIGKPVFPYSQGARGSYFQVTLPEEFTTQNHIQSEDDIVQMYYSSSCRGFLLLKPTTAEPQSYTMEFQEIKNSLEQGTLSFSPVLESFLREEILARIEQGYKKIVIKFNSSEESENARHFISAILAPAGEMTSMNILAGHEEKEKVTFLVEIVVKDDPDAIEEFRKRKIGVFDLRGLTSYMMEEVGGIYDDSVRLLEKALQKSQKDEIKALKIREARVDLLWAYLVRQLIRGNRYGLFCGSGRYTSISPSALAGFYKLLEHSVDQMMGIDRALCEGLDMGRDTETNRFVGDLIDILKENLQRFKRVEEPLLNAIENKLKDQDRKEISKLLKDYHENVRPLTGGGSGETYLAEVGLLGKMGDKLKSIEHNKVLVLSQALYPLQKLCKFPANMAMLARILDFGGST